MISYCDLKIDRKVEN